MRFCGLRCRQHAQQQVDEESPGWRLLLPTDAELLAEARRSSRPAGRGMPTPPAGDANAADAALASTAQDRSTAELCTLDMMAVLSQLRYLSALLHLLWRLLTAAGPSGSQARAAVAGCPRLLSTLCEIAVHRCVCVCVCARHRMSFPGHGGQAGGQARSQLSCAACCPGD